MPPVNIVSAFRSAAVAEALSWTGLLVGMRFTYALDAGQRWSAPSTRANA